MAVNYGLAVDKLTQRFRHFETVSVPYSAA